MTNRIPTPPDARTVIVGVDTHKHVHVAVAIDSWGIRLRDHAFVVDSGGYQALITWAETHGRIDAFGIEGTGSYGAVLARAVRRAGHRIPPIQWLASGSPASRATPSSAWMTAVRRASRAVSYQAAQSV